MYRNELNRAKAQARYYGELQRAFERRQNRIKLHSWIHRNRKYIQFFGGLLLFVFVAVFLLCGMMWAEGIASSFTNTVLVISMVLSVSTTATLLWVANN